MGEWLKYPTKRHFMMFEGDTCNDSSVKHSMLLMLFVWLIPTACLAYDWNITAEGYGPVHAGMSIKQAEKLLNTSLQTWESAKLNPACDFVYPKHGHDGVAFMVQGGVITKVEVMRKGVSTDRGIQIGDPVSKLVKVYGNALEKDYYPDGIVYFVWQKDRMRGIKYVTDEGPGEGRVIEIHGGDTTIKLVEGCS